MLFHLKRYQHDTQEVNKKSKLVLALNYETEYTAFLILNKTLGVLFHPMSYQHDTQEVNKKVIF